MTRSIPAGLAALLLLSSAALADDIGPDYSDAIATTANVTNGSATITVLSSAGVSVGDQIYNGDGTPNTIPGTCVTATGAYSPFYVTAVSGTTVTLNCPLRQTASGRAVKFGIRHWDPVSSTRTNYLGARFVTVGGAATGHSAWLGRYVGGVDYPGTALLKAYSQPGYPSAITAAARTSDAPASGSVYASTYTGFFVSDSYPNAATGGGSIINWQSQLLRGTNDTTGNYGHIHVQNELTINNEWDAVEMTPFSENTSNAATFIRTDCGTGQDNIDANGNFTASPQAGIPHPNNCTDVLEVAHNGAQHNAGIVFMDGALATGNHPGRAIMMPPGVGFSWWASKTSQLGEDYLATQNGGLPLFIHSLGSGGVQHWAIGNTAVAEWSSAVANFNVAVVAPTVRATPTTVSALTAAVPCGSTTEGSFAAVTDASTNAYGNTPSGGGSFHVPLYCDSQSWKVH